MVCKSCGRDNQKSEANFCEYCGASFREGVVNEFVDTPADNYSYQGGTGYASATTQSVQTQSIEVMDKDKPVSYLNWLGTYGIILIPFVGGLVFFIMLIIWSVSSTTPESKRNWARATLTFMIVMIILVLIIGAMFLSALRNPLFQELFQDSLNSEMDKYNDIFKGFSY